MPVHTEYLYDPQPLLPLRSGKENPRKEIFHFYQLIFYFVLRRLSVRRLHLREIPLDAKESNVTYPTACSVNLVTSAGGIIIAAAFGGAQCHVSGSETFADVTPQTGSQCTTTAGPASGDGTYKASIRWMHAVNTASSSANAVTMSFDSAPANGTALNLVAMSWR